MIHRPVPHYAEAGSAACPHGTDGDHERHPGAGDFWICLDAPMGQGCDIHTDDWGYGIPWGDCPQDAAL